jgi:hypothetical protein
VKYRRAWGWNDLCVDRSAFNFDLSHSFRFAVPLSARASLRNFSERNATQLAQEGHDAQVGPGGVDTTIVVFPHLSFRVAKKHPMS